MTINETELAEARVAWGEGIIAISNAYEAGGIEQARAVANSILRHLMICMVLNSALFCSSRL